MMKHRTLATTVAATLAAALVLTGCTATDDQDPAPGTSEATHTVAPGEEISGEHNDADVMFAQMMIPHHQQAVEMSEMLLAKDDIPQNVADFTQGVIDAQGPEIDRMTTMLQTWGEEPTSSGDMGGMHDDGMMSEEDMQQLEDATGTDAARLYLEQMITHHEGAVEMAEQQVSDGENPQAIALAEQVIQDQEAEIQEMETLLEDL